MRDDTEPAVTRALVDSVRELRYDEIPADAREVARHCLLDFLTVALAGVHEPLVAILVDSIVRPEGAEEARLIGRPERCTRLTAALVNGAAGHALDFDDTHMRMTGHPTVPVLPALLTLADDDATTGRALLTALVAGIELECRLGVLLGARHYEVGFHSTATLGTFGAAAACAHLLGLDAGQWTQAMGLAGSQAAGLKSAFGTMTKPLHAGRAASAGLLAALLARGGFTAATDVLEAKQGFFETHAGDPPDLSRLERLRGRFLVRDTLFKYHAACYLTHAAIEAARGLRQRYDIDPAAVDDVELAVAPALLRVCNIAEPRTGLEGKFSLRATTAMALLGADTADLATYSDRRMADPSLVRLRDRVRVVTDPGREVTRASLTLTAGARRFEAEADTGIPAADLGEQRSRLRRKFDALAAPPLGPDRAARLAAAALGVDEIPRASELLDLARPRAD
jgi:2-methylcitrate dehydratase PrpD